MSDNSAADFELHKSSGPHAKRIARELAMQYLFRCDMLRELPDADVFERFFEDIKSEHKLKDNRLGRKAKEYAEALALAVALNSEKIDEAIKSCSEHWSMERLSLVDLNIMRIAVAEMFTMDDVPPVVSIDEAVEIARDYSGEDSGNFINGVLNAIKNTLDRDPRAKR